MSLIFIRITDAKERGTAFIFENFFFLFDKLVSLSHDVGLRTLRTLYPGLEIYLLDTRIKRHIE